MGMFDSVFARCPDCAEMVEFQSKAGACTLAEYSPESAPPEILGDLANQAVMCKCGHVCRMHVRMIAIVS